MRATTLIAATTATLLPLAVGCKSPVEPRVEASCDGLKASAVQAFEP